MKKLIAILFIGYTSLALPQNAMVNFDLKNATTEKFYLLNWGSNHSSFIKVSDQGEIDLPAGKSEHLCDLSKGNYYKLYVQKENWKESYEYIFFIESNDSLIITIDLSDANTSYTVLGKGSENNQFEIQELLHADYDEGKHNVMDSIPQKTLANLERVQKLHAEKVAHYISYHTVSKELQEHLISYNKHLLPYEFSRLRRSASFADRRRYMRHQSDWIAIHDSLLRGVNLNNNELLNLPQHVGFLRMYVANEQSMRIFSNHYREEYKKLLIELSKDTNAAGNLLSEVMIQKRFSEANAEFLLAYLISNQIDRKEDDLAEIYDRFIEQYPNSDYTKAFSEDIKQVKEFNQRKLTDKMVFVAQTDTLKTMEQVLQLYSGKTVLIDMWGTWCAPCRKMIKKHAHEIKSQFIEEDIVYLYVANYDENAIDKWRSIIAYYNMEGHHINATAELSKNIMKAVSGTGFPTYVVVAKDGSFSKSKCGYPMDREVLYNEINIALNMPN